MPSKIGVCIDMGMHYTLLITVTVELWPLSSALEYPSHAERELFSCQTCVALTRNNGGYHLSTMIHTSKRTQLIKRTYHTVNINSTFQQSTELCWKKRLFSVICPTFDLNPQLNENHVKCT